MQVLVLVLVLVLVRVRVRVRVLVVVLGGADRPARAREDHAAKRSHLSGRIWPQFLEGHEWRRIRPDKWERTPETALRPASLASEQPRV